MEVFVMSTTAEVPAKRVGPQHTDGRRPEVDAAVDKLDKAIERFINDPKAFGQFLKYKGRMHNYSWNNTMLILIDAWMRETEARLALEQCTDDDEAAALRHELELWETGGVITMGYRGWQGVGRQVRKGSKAIALFKPVLVKDLDAEPLPSGKPRLKCVGFEIIHKTFHIQDTDGPEYDTPTPKPMHDTDDNIENSKNLCRWLSRTALDDFGVPKIMRDAKSDRLLGQAQGCMLPKTQTITRGGEKVTLYENTIIISSKLSYAQAAKTLTHEIAHVVAEHGKVTNYQSDAQARAACETIAEGAAYVVMAHYGYDTNDYTVPYIAGWAKDTAVVKQVIKDISDVAKAIIDKVDARMNPPKGE